MHIELDGEWNDREIRAGLRAIRPVPLWAIPVVSITIIATLVLLESGGILNPVEAYGPAIAIATVAVALSILIPRQIRRLVDIPSFTGPVTGLLTDEALFLTSRNSTTTAPWSQFRSVKFNESAAALVTAQRTSLLVLRNWFPDDGSWDLFTSSAPGLLNRPQDSVPAVHGDADDGATATVQPGSGDGVAFGGPFSPREYRHVIARMSPARRPAKAVVVLGALLSALTLISPGEPVDSTVILTLSFASIGIGLVLLVGLPALGTRLARRGVTADGVSGVADATGVKLSYGSAQSEVDWSAFLAAVRTDHGVGLMLNDQSGVVVVRSWFDSEIDWERFVALVLSHVEVARPRRFGPL